MDETIFRFTVSITPDIITGLSVFNSQSVTDEVQFDFKTNRSYSEIENLKRELVFSEIINNRNDIIEAGLLSAFYKEGCITVSVEHKAGTIYTVWERADPLSLKIIRGYIINIKNIEIIVPTTLYNVEYYIFKSLEDGLPTLMTTCMESPSSKLTIDDSYDITRMLTTDIRRKHERFRDAEIIVKRIVFNIYYIEILYSIDNIILNSKYYMLISNISK